LSSELTTLYEKGYSAVFNNYIENTGSCLKRIDNPPRLHARNQPVFNRWGLREEFQAKLLRRPTLKGKTMNEKENTRLVQQAYQSIKAGDLQLLLNSFAVDVQWQLPEMENVPFAGKWQGPEGVKQFFGKVFEVQDVVEFEPEEYIAQGDKVVVLGHFLMRIKATAREFGSDWAHIWTVKDGKVTRFYEYVDTAAVSRAHTAAKTAGKTA
jgi:uncharacterized protein